VSALDDYHEPTNVGEVYALARLSKSLGLECLVYHPVIVKPEDMQNTTTKSILWLNRDKNSAAEKGDKQGLSNSGKAWHGAIPPQP